METLYDVFRELAALLGAGPKLERALELIGEHEAASNHPPAPATPAPADPSQEGLTA